MSPQAPGHGRRVSWETSLLAWLTPLANLALAGVAAFVLAIPLVTAPAAAVAAGVALKGTREDDEDSAFLATFRAWRATWRRTLGVSVAGAVLSALLVVNWVFLLSRESPVAIVALGAMVPVSVLLLLLLVHLPAAVAWHPDGRARPWLREALALSLASPLRSLAVCVVVVTWLALCLLLPTIVPFFGLSVPVLAGLVSADAYRRRAGD